MAATATKQQTKKTDERPVVFESEATEATVLIKPGYHKNTDWGREEVRPVFAQFRPAQKRLEDGSMRWVGRFVVTDDESCQRDFDMTRDVLLDRLRSHGANRDNPNRVSGDFWGLHPSEYAPGPTEDLGRVARLAAARNRPALVEMLEEERAGFQRPDVLTVLEESLILLDEPEVT